MDVLAAFLADCCLRGEDEEAFAGELWGAWKRWCEETGEQAGSQKRFGGRLAERGFLNHRDSRSEEHTSELQSRQYLVCRLLLEKKKKIQLILVYVLYTLT